MLGSRDLKLGLQERRSNLQFVVVTTMTNGLCVYAGRAFFPVWGWVLGMEGGGVDNPKLQ